MISVDRSQVSSPISLTSSNGAGKNEKLQATVYYQSHQTKAFPFKSYKELDVVTALNTLFNDKCAYCESRITNTGPIDVEHFRPKGRITDQPGHPGYWWLATEWTNLLASCIDCNRGRKQTLLSSNRDDQQIGLSAQLSGKHDHFPIAGQRAFSATDDHSLEDPLLIDPTCVDPSQHLSWLVVADNPLVKAVSPYGQASINIFGLNRSKLTEARQELLLKLSNEFLCIEAMINKIAQEPTNEAVASWMPILQILIDNFCMHTTPKKEYSAFAKYIVNKKLEEISVRLEALSARIATTSADK